MDNKQADVIMIGAGPSALAAAVYTTREDMKTTLYEKAVVGGLVASIDKVDNYPGFPDGIEGLEFASQMEKQAKKFGANIEFGEVTGIRHENGDNIVTVDGEDVRCKAVLIASGSSYSKLNIPGEAENYGRGVHYCATCDGAFYFGKRLVVVGGGNSAVQEAMFLTKFASHIDLLVRKELRASEILQKNLQQYVDSGKITVHLNTSTDEIVASDGHVVAVKATKDGKALTIDTDGVFVFIGLNPNTGFLAGSEIELDEAGFIKTDHELQTNIAGVFASGDVRSGSTMQIASAIGEGVTAAISIREYINKLN